MTRISRISAALLLAATATLASAVLAQADTASPLDTIFGTKSLGSTKWDVHANAVVQWKAMSDRFKQQQADCKPADGCEKFKVLVKSLAGLSALDQLKAVRRAERPLPYVEDIVNYKQQEYWATPYEMLSIGSGDTEDYAILSYYALRAAGMPAASMRVIAGRLTSQGGVGHALLAVDIAPEPQILDDRVTAVLAASMMKKEFQATIGLNEDGWWVYLPPK